LHKNPYCCSKKFSGGYTPGPPFKRGGKRGEERKEKRKKGSAGKGMAGKRRGEGEVRGGKDTRGKG
jgi:hypothetical protein